MPYIHCPFTLDLTDGAALTHGPVTVVPTIRPNAVYPLDIHTRIDGGCENTHGRVPVVAPKRPHAIYQLHNHSTLDGPCALTQGTGTVLPTIRPHAVYPLHMHISLDGGYCRHSREWSRSVTNSATCRLAHSQ